MIYIYTFFLPKCCFISRHLRIITPIAVVHRVPASTAAFAFRVFGAFWRDFSSSRVRNKRTMWARRIGAPDRCPSQTRVAWPCIRVTVWQK